MFINRNGRNLFQLAAIALNFGVLVTAVYEGIYARRGGDPTKIRVVADPRAATINNPGYREHQPTNGEFSEHCIPFLQIKRNFVGTFSIPLRISISKVDNIAAKCNQEN